MHLYDCLFITTSMIIYCKQTTSSHSENDCGMTGQQQAQGLCIATLIKDTILNEY